MAHWNARRLILILILSAYTIICRDGGVCLVFSWQQETHWIYNCFPERSVTIFHLHEDRSRHVHFFSLNKKPQTGKAHEAKPALVLDHNEL